MNEGDDWTTRNDLPRAIAAYDSATRLLPDAATNGEAVFWTGISLAGAGKVDDALPYLRRAFVVHSPWADLVPRLPNAGLLPADTVLVSRLVREMRRKP
jgi:tetratricopeptide (TPR) repeat protein